MRTPALFAALALVLVTGCGASHRNDEAGVDAALAQSPLSYLHYTAPIWWGTRPNIHRDSLAFDGAFALARISAPESVSTQRKQWVLLERDKDGWQVRDAVAQKPEWLPCSDAPRQILSHLVGGCVLGRPGQYPSGYIEGPSARQAPTSGEVAALTAVARRVIFGGHDSCVTYVAAISKVDRRFATVGGEFHKPYGNCRLSNGGTSLFKQTSNGWTHVSDGDPFPCTVAPAGVLRSLFGGCALTAR